MDLVVFLSQSNVAMASTAVVIKEALTTRSCVVLKFPALKLSLKGSLASLFAECDPFLGKYQFL